MPVVTGWKENCSGKGLYYVQPLSYCLGSVCRLILFVSGTATGTFGSQHFWRTSVELPWNSKSAVRVSTLKFWVLTPYFQPLVNASFALSKSELKTHNIVLLLYQLANYLPSQTQLAVTYVERRTYSAFAHFLLVSKMSLLSVSELFAMQGLPWPLLWKTLYF